jgi:signal transduction histidine kinase
LLEIGRGDTTQLNVFRKDGSQLPVELMVTAFASSSIERYLVCFRDVSARVEAELAKRDFVAMVSHDLRSPLTSLNGTLGLMADGMEDGAVESTPSTAVFQEAAATVGRLVELINDFLDMGKLDSGQNHLNLTEVPLRKLLSEAVETASRCARDRGIAIKPDLSESVDAVLLVDYDRLVRALSTVIEVMVCHSLHRRSIYVIVTKSADVLSISIAGENCVLPAGVKETIRQGYGLLETNGVVSSSSPLGLALSRVVLNAHGGQIRVAGTPFNQGLEVTLPR